MKEIKHTPTPWYNDDDIIRDSQHNHQIAVMDFNASSEQLHQDIENAKFICQAVNTYYEREALIKELKEVIEANKAAISIAMREVKNSVIEKQLIEMNEVNTAALSSANKQI